jgi:enoyl-CoA hydratase/carnithine racemase
MVSLDLDTMRATIDEQVVTIVLNRPHVLNCVNDAWLRDFTTLIDRFEGEPGLRVIVIRADGRSFCTGIDLTALSAGEIPQAFFRDWEVALRRLETLDILVVAAIHGHCIGGGLQLALACDVRIARDETMFGITAVKEGIIPGMGMWRIARHAGAGRAKRLALTADVVDARTALDWGLVDHVVPAEAFEDAIASQTARLLSMAWTSTRLAKRLIDMAFDVPWAEGVDVFCEYQRLSVESSEHREAMAAWRAERARPRRRGSAV